MEKLQEEVPKKCRFRMNPFNENEKLFFKNRSTGLLMSSSKVWSPNGESPSRIIEFLCKTICYSHLAVFIEKLH